MTIKNILNYNNYVQYLNQDLKSKVFTLTQAEDAVASGAPEALPVGLKSDFFCSCCRIVFTHPTMEFRVLIRIKSCTDIRNIIGLMTL